MSKKHQMGTLWSFLFFTSVKFFRPQWDSNSRRRTHVIIQLSEVIEAMVETGGGKEGKIPRIKQALFTQENN